ncbi:hypothetical protein CC80DRAFT_8326 [Byssothecium circinans]|uniref:Uncharacterized protein n=1 Tax=Byssothecium circinans TaxID=147558 RepID=A0A6A5UF59_9PLEO|nr:hypothetical protein CC80DRAFT_8326 [Byssothecium circinans]
MKIDMMRCDVMRYDVVQSGDKVRHKSMRWGLRYASTPCYLMQWGLLRVQFGISFPILIWVLRR